MNAFSNFETVDILVSKQQPSATRKIDDQVLVEDTKKKWDEAKDGKEKTAALIAVNEMVLRHLNQANDCGTGDLVQLVEQYADLSLVGSCSTQAKSAVKFLEGMEMNTDEDKLKTVQRNLRHMKGKLELLNKIEQDVQKGVSG